MAQDGSAESGATFLRQVAAAAGLLFGSMAIGAVIDNVLVPASGQFVLVPFVYGVTVVASLMAWMWTIFGLGILRALYRFVFRKGGAAEALEEIPPGSMPVLVIIPVLFLAGYGAVRFLFGSAGFWAVVGPHAAGGVIVGVIALVLVKAELLDPSDFA